jgi:gluconokinase
MSSHKLVVMGVAGCGKSTVGSAIAQSLGCGMLEGDDYHPPASKEKMAAGRALEDSDRWPWLQRLGEEMRSRPGATVVSCSALKRTYRELLRASVPGLRFVFVDIPPALALERVAARSGHLFPPSLVASQFDCLQRPVGEPGVLVVDARLAVEHQVDAVLAWLQQDTPTSHLITS